MEEIVFDGVAYSTSSPERAKKGKQKEKKSVAANQQRSKETRRQPAAPAVVRSPQQRAPKQNNSSSRSPSTAAPSRSHFEKQNFRPAVVRSPPVVQPRAIKSQNVDAAVKNQLFGWRSFLMKTVALPNGTDRLVFANVTDVKISMLMREAERKQLCYCISGPAEVALQRAPFFREISSSKFQENVIAERIWKSGCCVTESGMIQHWKNIGKEKEAEKMLESETLVRLSIGKIKFVQIATKMSPVANTVTIDCNQSLATEEGKVETILLSHLRGSMKTNIRSALTSFANSESQSVIVDPSLTNTDRALVHGEARKLGLKTKSDGPEGARVLTCWKPTGYRANFGGKKSDAAIAKKTTSSNSLPRNQTKEESVVAAPAVFERDNSNSCIVVEESVNPIPFVAPPAAVSDSWICGVCEADNTNSETACGICLMERDR